MELGEFPFSGSKIVYQIDFSMYSEMIGKKIKWLQTVVFLKDQY